MQQVAGATAASVFVCTANREALNVSSGTAAGSPAINSISPSREGSLGRVEVNHKDSLRLQLS
jgi:hypothetical protein